MNLNFESRFAVSPKKAKQMNTEDLRENFLIETVTGSRSASSNGNHYFYYHCNYCGQERYPVTDVNETFETIVYVETYSSDKYLIN